MARLVTKFRYLKPKDRNKPGRYVKYIATRAGVEKTDEAKKYAPATGGQKQLIGKILKDFPDSRETLEYEDYLKEKTAGAASEFITRSLEENAPKMLEAKTYAGYIATRPGVRRFGPHGLFTDEGVPVSLSRVSDELNRYRGNVWTVIISLRRGDAERLGFNKGERWRDMLRTQTQELSDWFHIPLQDLRWYAAFHNEARHPHVHLIVYSANEKQAYLSKQGVNHLRSSFAKAIFAQDLLSVYEKQTEYRESLKQSSRELAAKLVSEINAKTCESPAAEEKLLQLAGRLSKTKGKKVYGYLKADVKALVDSVADELAKDGRIAALYGLWYRQREEAVRTYTEALPQRVPLSQNREFKAVKNMIIREAMNLTLDRAPAEESDEPENQSVEWNQHRLTSNEKGLAAVVAFRLLGSTGRLLQDRMEDKSKGKGMAVDRKLRGKIAQKKQAQGLRQG